jgi:Transposase IS116/IS110/IS902 family
VAAGGLRLRAAHGAPAAAQGDRVGAAEDRVDAATLAQLLRADLLPEAWIAPPAVRQLRAMLRHRVQLVRLRTLLRTPIHAVLADHGHGRPAGCWSGPGRQWLAALELPAVSREVIDDALALTGALQQPIGRLDREIRQQARSDPRVKVLTQLPGVGESTALVLLGEIGDISRFGSARKLAARTSGQATGDRGAAMATERASFGSFLPVAPDPAAGPARPAWAGRRAPVPRRDQLLGQQVPQPADALDRPGPLRPETRPAQQPLDLRCTGPHPNLAQVLLRPDRHRGMRSLMRVHPDHCRHRLSLSP